MINEQKKHIMSNQQPTTKQKKERAIRNTHSEQQTTNTINITSIDKYKSQPTTQHNNITSN